MQKWCSSHCSGSVLRKKASVTSSYSLLVLPGGGIQVGVKSRADIPKLCSTKHLQVLRKEIGKKNKTNVTIWKLWICAATNCIQVRTGYKWFSPCSVLWSNVHSQYYRPKCMPGVSWISFAHPLSRNHAKHRECEHLVFLRTFRQLREHSVESRKESSSSAVLFIFECF